MLASSSVSKVLAWTLLVTGIVIFGGLFQFLISSNIVSQGETLRAINERIARYELLLSEEQDLNETLNEINRSAGQEWFFSSPNSTQLQSVIRSLAAHSGVSIQTMNASSPGTQASFSVLGTSLSVIGTHEQLNAFLADMRNSRPLLEIINFTLIRYTNRPNQPTLLNLQVEIRGYARN